MHKERLNQILTNLNIDGVCTSYNAHRHLAFYDVELNSGTMVNRLERRTREIALGLRTKTSPIVQVLPEKGIVRLRVATKESETLYFKEISHSLKTSEKYLPLVLGETDEGKNLIVDLSKHPHTLVSGATGSGKSVFLQSIIANAALLKFNNIHKIQLFLSDPKKVEFNSLDIKEMQSLISYTAYDYDSTINMLEFLQKEMEGRYAALAKFKKKSVMDCPGIFSSIILIIDEVNDLMMQDKKIGLFQHGIVKLAQKCRAAGIYIILATQRPSVDVLTGLIKANFPARISFKVGSRVDSQVILDAPGAESLLGKGDGILQSPEYDRVRFQAAFIDSDSIISDYVTL